MAKVGMDAVLKRRMTATQQASELQTSDDAYQQIFRRAPPPAPSKICDLPLDKLDFFFTADIGFKMYPPLKLKAFAQQLKEEGLLIRIIVRRIPDTDRYEILPVITGSKPPSSMGGRRLGPRSWRRTTRAQSRLPQLPT